jgi:phage host-nuclease inhibitor protein Gam
MSDPLNPKRFKSVSLEPSMMKRIGELNTENARLKTEIEQMQAHFDEDTQTIADLNAEIERLREEQKIKAIPVEAKIIDRLAELKAEVSRLKSKNNLLREAGDDLWYCIRHNDKLGMQEAIEEWKDARHD